MSDNKRIFYACQAVAISKMGDDVLATGDIVYGAQSVGVTTTFNLEQAFELGQIEIYENIEGTPDIEVTLEKVLDGRPLIYHMATTGVHESTNSGIASRATQRCDLRLGIFDEAANNVASANIGNVGVSDQGAAEVEVYCSGMYVSSVSYTVSVDDNATESVTLVGNNKQWLIGNDVKIGNGIVNELDGSDSPVVGNSGLGGGVQRREDVLLAGSILPQSIQGVIGSGYGNALGDDGFPRIHVQSFSCSVDFGREDILELGRKAPYYRAVTFPLEVTCDIEATTTSGDFVSAYEYGDPALFETTASGDNVNNENIFLCLRTGYAFDLGSKNRLSSITYGGGDAGGGNATASYSYVTYNEFDVQDINIAEGYIGFNALKIYDGTSQYVGGFPSELLTR